MYFASLIKSAISLIYVYVTFVVCWLPYFISVAVIEGNRPNIALRRFSVFSLTLIRLNSSLNPLIYHRCWKMRHIWQAIISLRSKRSRTTRTKMQPECEKSPSHGPNFVRVVRDAGYAGDAIMDILWNVPWLRNSRSQIYCRAGRDCFAIYSSHFLLLFSLFVSKRFLYLTWATTSLT